MRIYFVSTVIYAQSVDLRQEYGGLMFQTESYSRHAEDTHTYQSCPGSGLWGFGGFQSLTGNIFITNSSDTSENIFAVDWGAIPGVLRRFRIM